MTKILIIEDEFDTAKVVRKRLSEHGFQSIIAVDGYHGVEFAHKERPDLIILDLMLPAGDGLSVLKNLRFSMHTMNIPVIVLTGIQDEKYKQQVLDEGVDAYMEKPYEASELIDTIKKILGTREV